MSHSLNRSHIRLAYFQPMASCLADGFFPSRLICKIKNFFDVFFTFFSYFLLELAELKTHKEIRMPAGFLEMHQQALLSVRTSRSFPDIKSCHMFSDRQIFAEVFWCGRIAGKISNKKNDVSAPAIIKIYERILKGQRYICNIYTLPYIQKI